MAEGAQSAAAAIKVVAAAETDIGRRQHNEDAVLLRPDLSLYVLADGAGGENAGNVASTLACTSLAHFFEDTQAEAAGMPMFDDLGLSTAARRLSIAVQRANRDIIEIAKSGNRYHGMGTTVVAAHVQAAAGVLHLAHVGDSRCYRVRDGRIEQLTQDHTLINDVLEMKPDISNAQAVRLPRNVITRALGMAESVRVSVRSAEIATGDRYLLCSDGITDVLDDGRLHEILQSKGAPEAITRKLVETAKASGAQDNLAALVIACDAPPGSLPFRQGGPPPILRVRRESAPQIPSARDPDLSWPEILVMTEEPAGIDVDVGEHESTAPPELIDAIDEFFEAVTPARPGLRRKYHTLGYEDSHPAIKIPGRAELTRKVPVAPPPDVAPPPPPRASTPEVPPPRASSPGAPPAPKSVAGTATSSPRKPAAPPPKKSAPVDEILCGECGAAYDGTLPACPDCGSTN